MNQFSASQKRTLRASFDISSISLNIPLTVGAWVGASVGACVGDGVITAVGFDDGLSVGEGCSFSLSARNEGKVKFEAHTFGSTNNKSCSHVPPSFERTVGDVVGSGLGFDVGLAVGGSVGAEVGAGVTGVDVAAYESKLSM